MLLHLAQALTVLVGDFEYIVMEANPVRITTQMRMCHCTQRISKDLVQARRPGFKMAGGMDVYLQKHAAEASVLDDLKLLQSEQPAKH